MVATILQSSNHISESNTTTINNLFDDSLIEIFCRLPCKFLFTCKSVSKHWFTLISDPNFHSLYITHQHSLFKNLQTKEDQDLDQHHFILKPYNALVIIPNSPSLQFDKPLEKHLHVNFLGSHFEPTNVIPELTSVSKFIFGCSNGLLLCGNPRQNKKCIYHVCNPLTKVSLELPCAPTLCDRAGVLVGFMCDPYYRVEKADNVFIATSNRRFRVVCIPAFTYTCFSFNVEVFYSETGNWNQFVVSCTKGFACGFYLTTTSVAHDGKLYFMGQQKILVYDPYNNEHGAFVIDLPSEFGEVYKGCLGVSCGCLRLSKFPIERTASIIDNMHKYSGKVWELQCYDCGNGEVRTTWRLVHEFYLPNIVGPVFEELKDINVRPSDRFLAFHPYVEDTVFLKFGDYILSCNLLTHRFKASKYDGLSLVFYPITPVVLPWWPTPIPLLPLSPDCKSGVSVDSEFSNQTNEFEKYSNLNYLASS